MSKHPFQVEPVRQYEGARYPSRYRTTPAAEPSGEEGTGRPFSILRACATLVLVLGATFGLTACPERWAEEPDAARTPDAGPDAINDGGVPICTPGEVMCTDEMTLGTCESGGWVTQDCDERCVEQLGVGGYSLGCDAAQADPCQCEYDIIDGDIAECSPGEVQCFDGPAVGVCVDWAWQIRTCDEVCKETYGIDAYAIGCDAAAAEPCLCETDIIDGMVASCTPGEVYCWDVDTIAVCQADGYSWLNTDCPQVCLEAFGTGYLPGAACDMADPANPCGCHLP